MYRKMHKHGFFCKIISKGLYVKKALIFMSFSIFRDLTRINVSVHSYGNLILQYDAVTTFHVCSREKFK